MNEPESINTMIGFRNPIRSMIHSLLKIVLKKEKSILSLYISYYTVYYILSMQILHVDSDLRYEVEFEDFSQDF